MTNQFVCKKRSDILIECVQSDSAWTASTQLLYKSRWGQPSLQIKITLNFVNIIALKVAYLKIKFWFNHISKWIRYRNVVGLFIRKMFAKMREKINAFSMSLLLNINTEGHRKLSELFLSKPFRRSMDIN